MYRLPPPSPSVKSGEGVDAPSPIFTEGRGSVHRLDREMSTVFSRWNKNVESVGLMLTFPLLSNFLLDHPRRPRGSQSGREKGREESFQVQAKKPLGTDYHRTISKNSSGCRLLIGHKKRVVLLFPIGEQFLLRSFREFVHDGYCFDHNLSGACTKEMHAVRKLSVWYKLPIWFQNTVCSKTKDAFLKIQAWAYNRYWCLHRSRLAHILGNL